MVDDALLALADVEAERRGQTRRVFVERAIRAALHESDDFDIACGVLPAIEGMATQRTAVPVTVEQGRTPKAAHPKPATHPVAPRPTVTPSQSLRDGVASAALARQRKLNEAKTKGKR